MKGLLLYGPLLWMRKIVVYLLITAIVLGLLLYFVLNSALVVRKVANTFAPDYNISYGRIHGNVLTGVNIDDLYYDDHSLAKHITLKWNPVGLLRKTIIVDTLQIEKANVDTIRTLIASFSSTDKNESNESSSAGPLGIGVSVHHASLSLAPFTEQGIDISSTRLNARGIAYEHGKVNIAKLGLKVDSNVTNLVFNAKVKENHLRGQASLVPTKELLALYAPQVRQEAIGNIMIDLDASPKYLIADLNTKMKQLLVGEKDDFNLDIDSLQSHVVYEINDGIMKADTKVMLSTPYAKDILVTNHFIMDHHISYSGKIDLEEIIGIDAKFVKPLNNLQVKYEGDDQSIKADIESENLQGTLISSDFKKADLHLENKEALALHAFIDLPPELNQTKADIVLDAPIGFEENVSMVAYAKIDSNVVNVDANISFKETIQVRTLSHIPEDSLLRAYSEKVKWDRLNPIKCDAELVENTIDTVLTAGTLSADARYDLNSTKVEGKVTLGGLNADVSGIVKEKITVDTKINSMNTLIENIKDVYTLGDIPVVKGSADLSVVFTEMKEVDMTLKSPQIIYQAERKTEHYVKDIDLALAMNIEDQNVVLNRYTFTYAGQKLFSTKPSTVSFDDTNVSIAPLWINDQLKVEGKYNLQTRKGTIEAEADTLHLAHEIIDLDSNLNIKTVLDGNKTSVNGEITLLGGHIHYDLGQKTYASDSDIIIVQDMKKEEPSPFMDGLSASVQIKTKQPLIYKKGDIDIKADVDVNVYKAEGSELMVLGSVEIREGGSYTFEGKKFMFDKSFVHFTGDPNKPLLEASVHYTSLHHLITIQITGSADTPNITFSSKPSLTKEQILSIILFDSEAGAGTNSGEDMMKMMGGAMAKSALSNLGVQLDYLVLGEGSVEVGKKLTDEITIIYVNDEISSVKLKYEHGKRTESVIGVSEESQSYDIIYKKDF